MIFAEKIVTLKNGQFCLLRSPKSDDAADMLSFMRQTSSETNFMARYDDEITTTPDEEGKILSDILGDPERIMIAAFIDGKLVANIGFSRLAPFERARHRAEFGISIMKEYWSFGLGSVLLSELIESARIAGYEQLELEVVAENECGLALYKKFGFETYGTRPDTFKYRDAVYRPCHLMLKKL